MNKQSRRILRLFVGLASCKVSARFPKANAHPSSDSSSRHLENRAAALPTRPPETGTFELVRRPFTDDQSLLIRH